MNRKNRGGINMRGGFSVPLNVPAPVKPVYTPAEQAARAVQEAHERDLFRLVTDAPDVKTASRILDLWVSGDEAGARQYARGCTCTTAEAAGVGSAQPCPACVSALGAEFGDEIPFI